ncbi:MAG TPA: cytochrome c biogenesis protein CcdA, partial [Thermodesulfobacteriota bacterium]|nr:cytochrome c biogenesis protein CcdA [Thermodesulfobacteriota bacterium]
MSELQRAVGTWVETLVAVLPVGYAFGAGMVSAVNPCGFAMLPAYLSLCLGAGGEAFYHSSAARRALRALHVGFAVSAGAVLLFAAVGAGLAAGGRLVIPAVPWLAVAIGAALVGLGLWTLAGRGLHVGVLGKLAGWPRGPGRRGALGFFLFGVGFAAASLSCTLPVFLLVVGSALASGGFLAGLLQFVSYGLGMGVVLVALTLGVALFREGIVASGLRGIAPHLERVAAALLLLAGSYILYYWLVKNRLLESVLAAAGARCAAAGALPLGPPRSGTGPGGQPQERCGAPGAAL